MSPGATYEAWKCPDCGHVQADADDCENCSYGVEEEGWDSVTVRDGNVEAGEEDLVEVNG